MMKNPKNLPNSKQDYREKIHTPKILWNMGITRENKTLKSFKKKKEVTKNETQFWKSFPIELLKILLDCF